MRLDELTLDGGKWQSGTIYVNLEIKNQYPTKFGSSFKLYIVLCILYLSFMRLTSLEGRKAAGSLMELEWNKSRINSPT